MTLKGFRKVILKHKYKDYETALKELKLETLYKRRKSLCLKFAKKSSKLSNFKKTFPIRKKSHPMKQRKGRQAFTFFKVKLSQ